MIMAEDVQIAFILKISTDINMLPQAMRFLPAQEPGPQLRLCDAHTPMSLFKMFVETPILRLPGHVTKGHKYKWTEVSISEQYCYIGLLC